MESMAEQRSSSGILQKEIESQSTREAEEILGQAEREAHRILENARREAEKIRAETLRKAEVQAEGIRRKILSSVHLEVKNQALRTREELLSKIFQDVVKKLDALRQKKGYDEYLKKFIIEGILALDTDKIRILSGDVEKKRLNDAMIAQIKKDVKKQTGRTVLFTVADQVLPESGVVIVSADERMLFDNRFSTRMRRLENTLRLEAIKRVMG
jgi:V/A-type H+-transporting ATPase subunit E